MILVLDGTGPSEYIVRRDCIRGMQSLLFISNVSVLNTMVPSYNMKEGVYLYEIVRFVSKYMEGIMELNTEKLRMRKMCEKKRVQVTLDDDFNVPDSKSDLGKILSEDGRIEVTETNLLNGKLLIKGKLHFNLLYESQEKGGMYESIQGKIDFDEMLHMKDTSEEQKEQVEWELEDINISMINSRKISVKALVNLTCTTWEEYEEEITAGMDEKENLPALYKELQVAEYKMGKKDTLRVRVAFRLPASRPNVSQILYYDMEPQNVEKIPQNGQIFVRGDLQIFVVYRPLEEDRIYIYEGAQEFSGTIACEECREDRKLQMHTDTISCDLQLKPDEDGEDRELEAELVLGCSIHLYEQKKHRCLVDAYSLEKKLDLQKKNMEYRCVVYENAFEKRIAEQIPVEPEGKNLSQICFCKGKVFLDEIRFQEKEGKIEGNIEVRILYREEKEGKIGTMLVNLPFEQSFPYYGLQAKQMSYEISPRLEKISVNQVGTETLELRTVLHMNLIIFANRECELVAQIEEKEYEKEMLEKMPDMVGYVVQQEDTLWDLAKHFLTTENAIMSLNEKKGKELQKGEKLLIPVGSEE